MKGMIQYMLPGFLAMLFLTSSGFLFPSGEKAMVKLDGQIIKPEGLLKFQRDDTIYLEATGIEPNSEIEIKVKKLGIRWANHTFRVNDKGEVIGVIHMPEQKIKVSCTVNYYDADGTFNEVQFKFKVY